MSFQREHPASIRTPARQRTRLSSGALPSDDKSEQEEASCDQATVTRFVIIAKAASLTGLTEKAIRRKIEQGVWVEHRVWKRGPDGRIYIDLQGYTRWVQCHQ